MNRRRSSPDGRARSDVGQAAGRAIVEAGFAILDPQLGRHDFAVGDSLSIADAALSYVERWGGATGHYGAGQRPRPSRTGAGTASGANVQRLGEKTEPSGMSLPAHDRVGSEARAGCDALNLKAITS